MLKHLVRIGFGPIRIFLLLLALPFVALDIVFWTLLRCPIALLHPDTYAFHACAYWACLRGDFVPK